MKQAVAYPTFIEASKEKGSSNGKDGHRHLSAMHHIGK